MSVCRHLSFLSFLIERKQIVDQVHIAHSDQEWLHKDRKIRQTYGKAWIYSFESGKLFFGQMRAALASETPVLALMNSTYALNFEVSDVSSASRKYISVLTPWRMLSTITFAL